MDFNSSNLFFRCAHLNLNHCRRANALLAQDISKLGIDICSVNDPYYWENKVIDFPTTFRTYFVSSRPLAGFIISNPNLSVFPIRVSRKLVVLKITLRDEDWIFATLYCPPSHNISDDLDNLTPLIIQNPNFKTILLGDFNAKSPLWGPSDRNKRGEILTHFADQFDFTIVNDSNSLPTFIGPMGNSWIDLLLIRNLEINHISGWKIDDRITFSDHQIMDFFLCCTTTKTNSKTLNWSLDKLNFLDFKVHLNEFLDKCKKYDIDFEDSIDLIQNQLIKVCSMSRKKARNKERRDAVWWNTELEIQRSYTRALRRRFQSTYSPDLRLRRQVKFKCELAKYTKMIAEAKRTSFRNFLKDIVKVNTFDSFYRLIKHNTNLFKDLGCIKLADGSFTTSFGQSLQAILFHHFPILDSIQTCVNSGNNTFPKITYEELKFVLNEISPNKAPGPDGLTHGVIKQMINTDPEWFLQIFNNCLLKGIFPKCWKRTRVALIPKEGKDLSLPSSYRPICLLPTWGKILDKIITQRLSYELERGEKLHQNQFGFRKQKSTLLALDKFLTYIKNAKSSKFIPLALSLDMFNAFNSVNWLDIVNCLIEDGVSAYLINIIGDFLSHRKIIDSENKIDFYYSKGVPQGSSLGPVLWLVIADRLLRRLDVIKNEFPDLQYIMFADDILLLSRESASYKFTQGLETPIKIIETWAKDFGLSINPLKSQFIVFPIKKDITHIPRLRIGGIPIKHGNTLKYLGVSFDSRLTWLPHLTEIKSKVINLQGKLGRLSRATWGVGPQIIKEIYKVVIEKTILYGCEIWYDGTARCDKKLLQIQRLALLKITKAYSTASNESLQVLAGCVPIDIIAQRESSRFNFFYKDSGISIENREYTVREFDIINPYAFPPWDVTPFSWKISKLSCEKCKTIYTDGSGLGGNIGSGLICFDEEENILWQEEVRLNDEASVFLAEAFAIKLALLRVQDNERLKIFTDSKSVLQSLESSQIHASVILDIKNILKNKKCIEFYWVKAHIGIRGNEMADVLAKNATRRENIDHIVKIPKSWVNHQFKLLALKKWQQRWEGSQNSRFLFGMMPNINTKRCYGDFFINQILTTHGCFPQHQHRLFGKSPDCFCGRDFGTITHYVYGCSKYNNIREKFFPRNFPSLGILELVTHFSAKKGLRLIVQDLFELSVSTL
ncbi:Putative protein in type-1 retrotransposable element R1DM [Araneus ventricosus]|uniref:Retrovirus-related Pol polyprotein from type-1 retrotransposable element R1 n=1 Tax=Araneus ventricosus TaxID=182803 RepID=A0A4Y2LT25_ARAVE|nr:Putative protein in type-1 retrotransposable element R1DM [Araneus ventricosus]